MFLRHGSGRLARLMIYLKSLAAGLVGAVLGAVLMVALQFGAFAALAAWQNLAQGSGGFGAVMAFPNPPMLVFAAAGFVAGVWLVYRKRSPSTP